MQIPPGFQVELRTEDVELRTEDVGLSELLDLLPEKGAQASGLR